jgi:hypothetical protein
MTVPDPIIHWSLSNPAGSTVIVNEVPGATSYAASKTSCLGSGGDFGATGRGNGATAYRNPNGSDICRLVTQPSSITALAGVASGEEGAFSIWLNDDGSFNTSTQSVYLIFVGSYGFILSSYSIRVQVFDTAGNRVILKSSIANWGKWVFYTVVWSASSNYVKFYANGILVGSSTWAGTGSANIDTLDLARTMYAASIQDFKLWNVPLTEDQVNELFIGTFVPCERTIPLKQMRRMWNDVESTMPCKATIQRETIFGWSDIETNVPVHVELTGTRQELDSTDNYITIQNWVVTMSGRIQLPNPSAFSKVRFTVIGLTLESYDFYQSPDDIVTIIECKKV